MSQNGKSEADEGRTIRVTVTKDLDTFHCDVKYEGPNLDEIVNALQQALRYVEDERRFQVAQAKAAQLQQATKDRALAESIMGRRM